MRLTAPALAAAITFAAAPAFAHAFLQSASPKVGSTVATPPREVSITFSEAVEPSFSVITVSGPPGFSGAGPARPKGDARTLAAPLRAPLPPGGYVVRWRVVSTDSHTTQGTFRFELKP
jgi:methionine-rich copper-binding protein CopC